MIACKPIPIEVGDQYKMVRNDLLKILADANDWESIMCVWSALENLKGAYEDMFSNKSCQGGPGVVQNQSR
jgi:hypothetical protein